MSIQTKIIDPMTTLYAPPYGAKQDPSLVVAEYQKHLGGFSDKELGRGWDILVGEYRGRQWPSIAEIRECCVKARDQINPKAKYAEQPSIIITEPDVFNTLQGKKALEAGFGVSFLNTCRQQKRVLSADETEPFLRRQDASRQRMRNEQDGRLKAMQERIEAEHAPKEQELCRKYLSQPLKEAG
jgi:hypothetical protein